MNNYEVTYIIYPDVEEDDRTALNDRFAAVITDGGGKINKVDDWGKKQLAYEIDDLNEGHYIFMEFSCNADLPLELERIFRINDRIMRYMIIKQDD